VKLNHILPKSKITAHVLAGQRLYKAFFLVLLFIIPKASLAQTLPQTAAPPDTSLFPLQVLPGDTIQTDTVAKPSAYQSPIAFEIVYDARDSIDNDVVNKRVYLYGDATVTYGTITLKAAIIEYDFESYTVRARGVQDSLGVWSGLPNFKDGPSEFDAFTMDYNFRTRKAYVRRVVTEVIEGTLVGQEVKTVESGEIIFVRKGEYCPCQDPNAKTRFRIRRIKVIRNDKIVTGPGYLAFGKIPTPIAFPFGFFPNTDKKQAGLIVPSYGNGQRQGYFLNNLGFYLPVNEYVDTKILTDLYSRGSWAVSNITTYNRRYKYQGNLDFQYLVRKQGDKTLFNYLEDRSYFVTWRHTQDPKARPNSNFSADLNAGSSATFRNNLNANQNDFLSNTFRSSVRYQQRFYDSPWSFNVNAGHDQNSRGGPGGQAVYNFTLPEIAVNRARTFPLAGLFNDSPKQKFYEKIGLTYNSSFRNSLRATESELSLNNWNNLQRQFQNGVRHGAQLTTSFKSGPVSINPGFTYNERWYFTTLGRRFNDDTQAFEVDTLRGFDRNADWNMSVSATTKIFGMYTFKRGNIKAIRHTLTPSVAYSVRPDFDARVFGFFGPDGSYTSYSPYDGAIFGGPPSGRASSISLSLVNNIEAKVASRRDSTSKFVKMPLLENLTANVSYNIAADSLRLSMINVNGRTRITKYANINVRGLFEPYTFRAVPNAAGTGANIARVNTLLFDSRRKLASFENGSIALNAAGLSSAMFERKKTNKDVTADDGANAAGVLPSFARMMSGFKVPWNLTFGYTIDARRVRQTMMLNEGFAIRDSIAITQSLVFNGGFEFFKRVKMTFNSGYDFVNKELTPTTLFFTVDLNCWEFNARVVPFGLRRSYNLSLFIKSSMLRDLKLERNRNLGQGENFFF
jgi:hypothetical protein